MKKNIYNSIYQILVIMNLKMIFKIFLSLANLFEAEVFYIYKIKKNIIID